MGRKSVNGSVKKRGTQFKKGGTALNRGQRRSSSNGAATGKVDNFEHPARRDTIRLSVQQTTDINSILGTTDLPRLRPRDRGTAEDGTGVDLDDENLIVNKGFLGELLTIVHQTTCGRGRIHVDLTRRQGLCVLVSLHCKLCNFKTKEMPLSSTIPTQRGPDCGALNKMVGLAVLKTSLGVEEATNFLSCLNIRAPSKRTQQKYVNSVATSAIAVNNSQMEKSQQYVKELTSIAGVDNAADVQFDVAYASRPQGGCEKATQSYGAMVEHSTAQRLPLAIGVANKHCTIRGCPHKDCGRYKPTKTISSSEKTLLGETLDRVDNLGHLKINSITTDASAQTAKAIRDYYNNKKKRRITIHYLCFIHRLRTLGKHILHLDLKSIPKPFPKKKYLQQLASSVRSRVRRELVNLRTQRVTKEQIIRLGSVATSHILHCFSGDHQHCQQKSSVCIAHRTNFNTSHLPFNRHLELDENDLRQVQNKINRYFDSPGIADLPYLYNTNMCESLNAAVFKIAPKTAQFKRNWDGKCHSATHSWTVGTGRSTVEIASSAGIPVQTNSALYLKMRTKDKNRRYHSARQQTKKYKDGRFYRRKRASIAAELDQSLYSADNMPSCSSTEHNYGLSS